MQRRFSEGKPTERRRRPVVQRIDAVGVRQRTNVLRPQDDATISSTVEVNPDATVLTDVELNLLFGDLLENECFLSRVLSYLLDFGLHECRRVCRKWYYVCKRLPVQLINVPTRKIENVPSAFPDAVSLHYKDDTDPVWPAEVLRSLFYLPNLKHLGLVRYTSNGVPNVLVTHITVLTRLESLHIYYDSEFALQFWESLKCLTLLTKFEIKQFERHVHDTEPLSQLKRLQELQISHSLATNLRGELLFPPASSLTRLEIIYCQDDDAKSSLESLLLTLLGCNHCFSIYVPFT